MAVWSTGGGEGVRIERANTSIYPGRENGIIFFKQNFFVKSI